MEAFLKRLGISIIFFSLGMHGIGYGIAINGGAGRWNPVWRFMQSYYDFEWGVVRLILIVAGAGVGLFGLVVLVTNIHESMAESRIRATEEEKRRRRIEARSREDAWERSQAARAQGPAHRAPGARPSAAIRQVPEIPAPVPRKLTADELRKRAIAQFTKGR